MRLDGWSGEWAWLGRDKEVGICPLVFWPGEGPVVAEPGEPHHSLFAWLLRKGSPPWGEGWGVQPLPGAAGWQPFSLRSHLTPMTQAWPCPWRAMGQSELITTARSRSGKQVHPLPPAPRKQGRG